PDLPKPDAAMLQIAEKIIEQQSGEFDPSEFNDRYEDALRALIEEKRKGKPVKPTKPANDDGKVIDLMAALKKSLAGGAQRRPANGASKKKPNGRRAAEGPPPDGHGASPSRRLGMLGDQRAARATGRAGARQARGQGRDPRRARPARRQARRFGTRPQPCHRGLRRRHDRRRAVRGRARAQQRGGSELRR